MFDLIYNINYSMAMKKTAEAYQNLYAVIQQLRAPGGCPWDQKQTPKTLVHNLIEETYECIDEILDNSTPGTREELGDIFLVITMLGVMYEEQQDFTLQECLQEVHDKIVRRHPHVFGDVQADNPEDAIASWNAIKAEEKRQKQALSLDNTETPTLDTLDSTELGSEKTVQEPKDFQSTDLLKKSQKSAPPLEQALHISQAAVKLGFEWPDIYGVYQKVHEELNEVGQELAQPEIDQERMEEEIGDLLFTVVNLARKINANPALLLHRANRKFMHRFATMERIAHNQGVSLGCELDLDRYNELWELAKVELKQ